MAELNYQKAVERWSVFEASFKSEVSGNPFQNVTVTGTFKNRLEEKKVKGFYDGDGIFRIRFMPSYEGSYEFTIEATNLDNALTGTFEVTAAGADNHGPVRTANTYHFAYEDGTPYYSIGTTCYVWGLQSDERIEETFESLKNSAFNKIRFCIFPKHYDYNLGEPRSYPYVGTPMDSSVLTKDNFAEYTGKTEGNNFDKFTFNPEHFRHIEKLIGRLMDMGIEADLIVMHPYDRWGFSSMTKVEDDFYWSYVIARFAAYEAANLLEKEGIKATVIDMYCLKPFDTEAITSRLEKAKLVVSVEEHSPFGGLGSRVSQVVGENCPRKTINLALPDAPVITGTSKEVFDYYGLTAEGIAEKVKSNLA